MKVSEYTIPFDYSKLDLEALLTVEIPTSPFLTVYRPQYTSMFSIVQRISGVILTLIVFIGVIILKLSKLSLSYYEIYSIIYVIFQGNIDIFFELTIIFFILFNFYYHLYFGLRYIYWDLFAGGDNDSSFKINLDDIKKTNIYISIFIFLNMLFTISIIVLLN